MIGIPSAESILISTSTRDPVARVAADVTVADVAKAMVATDMRPAALVGERDGACRGDGTHADQDFDSL